MANSDHRSNIGLHPVLDPDPAVHIPAIVEAGKRNIAAQQAAIDAARGGAVIEAGSQVTVTIGRNSDQGPLHPARWAGFRADVADLLSGALYPKLSFIYSGTGEWDGVLEDSEHFVAVDTTVELFVEFFESDLQALARQYGQDAIAYSVGQSKLVAS